MFNKVLSVALLLWAGSALAAHAQSWAMVETEGTGGAGAFVCADATAAADEPPCLRVTCDGGTPLHYEIALFGAASKALADEIAVEVRVDNRAAGLLLFEAKPPADGYAELTAPFDPRLHRALIAALRKGNRAELVIQNPAGAIVAPLSLRGSSKTLGAVMETCPMPEVPLNDPAAVVLDEVVRQCGALGGSVAMEPGFERHEDLDGDGQDDVVIDYAAAVCSEMASLYCGSGGCTVGFFLARDGAYERLFDGVIRGYSVLPDGLLALDLHGTACGLYGFEACRKVFRISDDSFALVDELAGEAAEAAQAADLEAAEAEDEAAEVAAEADEPEAAAPDAAIETSDDSAEPMPAPPAGMMEVAAPAPVPAAEADAPTASKPVGEDDAAPAVEPAAEPAADAAPEVTPDAVDEPEEAPAPEAEAPELGAEPEADQGAPDPAPSEGEAPAAETGPQDQVGGSVPEVDAEAVPSLPAPEAVPEPASEAPAALPSGLEWMGDGGSVFLPAEGESLPADLDPDEPQRTDPAPDE